MAIRNDWKLLEARRSRTGGGRLVCIANQKGGVAKTTTAVNLAAAQALRGHRILVVDVDPQANATTGIGLDHRIVEASTYELLIGKASAGDVIVGTGIPNLFCAPSALDLAGAEIELAGAMAREQKLAEALEPIAGEYELVFLDCPPSLGLLTINALAAAHDLIVPVQCEYYALEGLGQLLATAERVRRSLNPELRIAGFLLTMYDGRTKLSSQVSDEVRTHFGSLVYETVIPRSVRLSEAPSFGETVMTLDPSSRGAIAYGLLGGEVESRYGLAVHVPPPRSSPEPARPVSRDDELPPGHGASSKQESRVGVPGPGGRGYGARTAEPPAVDERWPRREPWIGEVSR
jgi:chromosome partitioning protein